MTVCLLPIPCFFASASSDGDSILLESNSGGEFVEAPPSDLEWTRAEAIRLEVEAFSLQLDDPTEPLSHASELFEILGRAESGDTQGYWRAARATWMVGELMPLDQVDGRLSHFQAALVLADQGLVSNPDCAECMLWKFVSMGRIFTTTSAWQAARKAKSMAALLDDAIALNPQYRDNDQNSTLGNLHYSSAIFYRIVPDWFWLKWVLGVKGDKKRSLAHSRKALSLHPGRVDYQIELGTQLVCLGSSRNDESRLDEGLEILRQASERSPRNEDERREMEFAQMMLDEPSKACGYVGDGIIDVDEKMAKKKVM